MTTITETKSAKSARLAALGYHPVAKAGRCALCSKPFSVGQYVGKMPASWNPNSARRHAVYRYVERLKDEIRAKAKRLGIVVPAGGTR